MSPRWTRREALQASLRAGGLVGACACLGYGPDALSQLLHTPEDDLDRWYRGVCGLCGMADPLFIGTVGGRLSTVKGDASSPVSRGRLCTRGMALPAGLGADRRPTSPLLRDDPTTRGTTEGLRPVNWDEAMTWLARRVADAGPSSMAALLDSSLPCETHWLAGKLLRGHLGIAALDSDLRLHSMAGLVAAERSQGIPAPTGCLGDVDEADLLMVVGADPAELYGTLFARMVQCHRHADTPLILIDARRTLTVGLADVWVRPARPGTESVILDAMAHVLIRDGLVGESIMARPDFAPRAAHLASVSPEVAADVSGARLGDIEAAASLFAESVRTWSCHGRALSSAGTSSVRSLYDLHLLAGRLGDGSSVTGLIDGANALGALLMGSASERLPGLRSLDSPVHRRQVSDLWGLSPDALPSSPGPTLCRWVEAVERGGLSLLLSLGGNPVPLLPDNLRWRRALSRCSLVSASPVAPTETTIWADLVLPVSYSPLEERGCYVNLERRVQLTDPPPPPDGVPTSFDLVLRLASTLLDDASFSSGFSRYTDAGAERAWSEARSSTIGRPCDLSGADYPSLTEGPGLYWPFPQGTDPGDRNAPAGRHLAPTSFALSSNPPHRSPAPSDDRPLLLLVTRDSHHVGARELTGFVPELHHAAPRCWVEIGGADAARYSVSDGSWIAVESSTGVLIARAWITDRVPRGVVAVPEHYGALSDLEGGTEGREEPESLASLVTSSSLDAASGQPLTICPVSVRAPTSDELARRFSRGTISSMGSTTGGSP